MDGQLESIPKMIWHGAWDSLGLSNDERALVTHADGRLSVGELVVILGLPAEKVLATVTRLTGLRVLELIPASDAGGPRGRTPSPAGVVAATKSTTSVADLAGNAPSDIDVDLTPEHQTRINDMMARLDRLTHYEVLGIAKDADKKAIKRAYFELAGSFHPDRFFRKNLGSFKLKMETIFGRMTQAHDCLTKSDKRVEYDAYLRDHERSRGIETLLERALEEARRVETAIATEVGKEIGSAPDASGAAPGGSGKGALSGPATASMPEPPRSSEDLRSRRDAFARRLLGNRAPAPASRPSQPPPPSASRPTMSTGDAVEALRRRYMDRVRGAREANARRYAEHGNAALAADDPVAAVNALRVAVTLDPDNVALVAAFNKAQAAADTILCDMYIRQAKYEEGAGNWVEAAKSWRKVTTAREGDAIAHERAANAILKAEGDLHEAARLAQVACRIEPSNATYKGVLASVYLGAGLLLNARREVEAALQLTPHDDTLQALLRRAGG